MTKNLIKHGNSVAIVIDKPILELLNIDADTPLDMTTDGRNIILSPRSEKGPRTDILASLEKINRKFGTVLKKLGEGA